MVPALAVDGGDEHLQRCIAGPCSHAGEARFDADLTLLCRHDGVRHAPRTFLLRVPSALRFRLSDPVEALETGKDTDSVRVGEPGCGQVCVCMSRPLMSAYNYK